MLALLGVGLLAGAVGAAVVLLWGPSTGAPTTSCPAVRVAKTGLPSVVTIFANGTSSSGSGSGEIIRSGGYILTNDHVISVAGGAGGSLSVLYSNGHRSAATIVGRDLHTDLAVIKAEDGAKGLPVIAIGSSSGLHVGQPVVALGAPLGLSSTVTAGIVSALDRSLSLPADQGKTAHIFGAVQTDASINPGNSGGPLVDCHARLVGVNTAIITVPDSSGEASGGSVGLGFAIPVDQAKPLSDELIAHGNVSRPTLGLQAQTIPQDVADKTGVPGGLYVVEVVPGGPAATAGLQVSDIITEIDGHRATDAERLVIITLTQEAGHKVALTYVRNGQPTTVDVTLADPS